MADIFTLEAKRKAMKERRDYVENNLHLPTSELAKKFKVTPETINGDIRAIKKAQGTYSYANTGARIERTAFIKANPSITNKVLAERFKVSVKTIEDDRARIKREELDKIPKPHEQKSPFKKIRTQTIVDRFHYDCF